MCFLPLQDFYHDGFKTRSSIWFLSSVPKLANFVHALDSEEKRTLVLGKETLNFLIEYQLKALLNSPLDIVHQFSEEVISIEQDLEKSIIHGDLNEQNLLVRESHDGFDVFSAIDFGDSQYNPLVSVS